MADLASDSLRIPTGTLLLRRLRVVLLICAAGAILYAPLQLAHWRPAMLPSFVLHLLGLTLGLGTIHVLLPRSWARRHAWAVSTVAVSAAYVLVALTRALYVPGDYHTTAVLFVGAALTTASILPWGVALQAVTVGIGTVSLVAAAYHVDGSLAALRGDPAIAVTLGFVLSLLAAREITRYRVAHRRELLDRRRAEAAYRRLAARLEQRVAERTLALEDAHAARHRREAELAHVLRQHTIGEMAAALAHDINQPLCAIANYAQGAVQRLRRGEVDPVALREACEAIAQEGLRAGAVLRGLRRLVQRETTVSTGIDLNALAAEVVRIVTPQAHACGVRVRLDAGRDLPPVTGDDTQIEQVMLNLVLNGVQAAALAPGPRREVVLATARDGGEVRISVRDTGAGLSPAVRDRLFTPFVSTTPRGLGLGLAISRTIVESHGGRVWAQSPPDSGATFHVALPAPAPPC